MAQQAFPKVVVLMSNEEFQKLSTDEKIVYLHQAAEALKSGQHVTTPNGPFDPEKRRRES